MQLYTENTMDKIVSIWLLLSSDAVLCCNESSQPTIAETRLMSLELLAKIAKIVKKRSWTCIALGNHKGIPEAYQALCDEMKAKIILPVEYESDIPREDITIVFESNQIELVEKHPFVHQAILRMQRNDLPQLSKKVLPLLNHFRNVSIRHPELLLYDDQVLAIYKEELFKIGQWFLNKKELWPSYRLDCLTDRLRLDIAGECGAGVKSLAVGPTGELWLCPAAMHNGEPPCGHIFGNTELPNGHLLTREYSLPCGKCNALHCLRCTYLNKLSTFEFCVPPKNACLLANIELEVQTWFAKEAIKNNLWRQDYYAPNPPDVYDPYELVKVATEETLPIDCSWRRLVRFDGYPQNLQSSMMLDIIHGLQGWSQALLSCAGAGCAPSIELVEQDVLASLRRRTIEKYRDVVFREGCPTIHQLELSMCRVAQRAVSTPC